jgi:histidinol phosphatase-like enzyme (inositol monophosphatase family)
VGAEALRHYRGELSIELKDNGSPVTQADKAAEQLARDWIMKKFPKDGILGEEFGSYNEGAERRWIVDPIDGTVSFVHGVPLWGSLVAVLRGDEVLAGAIFCPAVDELVCAAPGEGSWWNGSRAHVSQTTDLAEAVVITTDTRFAGSPEKLPRLHSLVSKAAACRGWGDCYGYLLVATGRADIMIDPLMNPWDAAAVIPVIQEAGGVFTDWKGQSTAFGGDGAATNAGLADVVRDILSGKTS